MSSINFESVCIDDPDLTRAVHSISDWVRRHEESTYLTMPVLLKELSSKVAWKDLVRVLAQLERKGLVDVRYRVQFADGTLSDNEYFTPSEIPAVEFDSSFQPVDVQQDMIVPVYVIDAGR